MASGKAPIKRTLQAVVPNRAAGTSAAATIGRAPFDGTIVAATYAPSSTIAGVNTNTRKVSVNKRGSNGSAAGEAAALQFDSGVNATNFAEKALTLSGTEADLAVAAGTLLTFDSEAVGTGLADPGGTVFIEIERA